jgi:hypothetical protein
MEALDGAHSSLMHLGGARRIGFESVEAEGEIGRAQSQSSSNQPLSL